MLLRSPAFLRVGAKGNEMLHFARFHSGGYSRNPEPAQSELQEDILIFILRKRAFAGVFSSI
jgi:hypothetical protein